MIEKTFVINGYQMMIDAIKVMDDAQQKEFFQDFESDEEVHRLLENALLYLDNRPCENIFDDESLDDRHEKSEDQENREADYDRRAKDHMQSEKEGAY